MQRLRYLFLCGVGALVLICPLTEQSAAATESPGLQSQAQSDKRSTTERVRRWTKDRLEAAKKHSAEDQRKFSDCSKKLDELKKTKRRLSFHRQGHFLEKCMRENRELPKNSVRLDCRLTTHTKCRPIPRPQCGRCATAAEDSGIDQCVDRPPASLPGV